MAESIVFGITENILVKLGSLVYQQLCLACGVKTHLEKLEDILSNIRVVLLDAEQKQLHDHGLTIWLQNLKDACYHAEDVLDEFEVEALQRRVINHQSIDRKVRNFFSCSNPLAFRFRMGHQIKNIIDKFDEIAATRAKFNLIEQDDTRRVVYTGKQMTHSFVLASTVIGRDEDKEEIINRLMHPSGGQNVSVIPIVGIGGLGKTTLAKLVYNDKRVVQHFQLKIWVCVSEDFDLKQLMIKIINSATSQNHSNLDIDQLQRVLRDTLDGKRYLLVLDDVWNEDPRKWVELKTLLLGGDDASKIIVTTRSNRVASVMGTIPKYELAILPHKSCRSLFMKCAFEEEQEKLPNLINIGEEIVKKCGGNPLAVITLGSLLYSSIDEHYWKSVRDNEIWELEQKKDDILPALRLSYDQLPSYLKQCFVYCSMFPKDHEFDSVTLVYFWMAQGLLQSPNENQELEDIGMQYLKELWSRSFFQDFDPRNNLVIFKMHDLMHDLAVLVAKNEFVIVNSSCQSISKKVRHSLFVDVDKLGKNLPGFLSNLSHLRTISFPIVGKGPNQSFLESCILQFQFLRVLVLECSCIDVLPKKIGNLKHLRYLVLIKSDKIMKLPNSIWKLQSLQTLVLVGFSKLKELPREIKYLTNLRLLTFTTNQKFLPENGIGCLSSLRFLLISSCVYLESLFEDIGCLKALHTLIIDRCPSLASLPHGIKYLSSLETLIFTKCGSLSLELRMELEEEDNQHDLGMLIPNLRFLVIEELSQLEELPQWLFQGSANSLRCLYIVACPNIIALPESLQNLESLEELHIINCPKLSSLPEHMHHLTSLRKLEIKQCPTLRERCKREIGGDWPKIAHISYLMIEDDLIEQY